MIRQPLCQTTFLSLFKHWLVIWRSWVRVRQRYLHFFFISMRNLIKIYFTYTTKHYEFRFFFRTVTLLCFENGLLPSTLIRQSAPYYHTTLNLKKKMFKEYWYIHIGRSWKILYYWNSILFCENKIETNIRHALFLFSA